MGEKNSRILYGRDYWTKEVTEGLNKEEGEECVRHEIYRDAPDSLYISLKVAAARWGSRVCLTDDDGRRFTYTEFLFGVNLCADRLKRQWKIKKGMHVGLILYNSVEFFAELYALNRIGAVAVPFSTKYKWEEVRSLMEKADLDGIIFHEDFSGWFAEKKKEIFYASVKDGWLAEEIWKSPKTQYIETEILEIDGNREDPAVLMFTSGTTSKSKGVILKNYNLIHGIMVYQRIFKITCEDKTVLPVPAYHITGMNAVGCLFLHCGGAVWLHKYFDGSRVLEEMEKQRLTFFHASPTVYTLLLEELEKSKAKLNLRLLACGSGNMPVKKIAELKKKIPGADFRTVYGLTETSSPGTILPCDVDKYLYKGTAGCPVPGMEFKIMDEYGRNVPPPGIGSVWLKGTNVTERYYKAKESLIRDGWLDTGDLGYFNEEGYLFIVDRKKDMINRGGEKICSYDVENQLCEIPGVREAAVVGIPDEKYGEVPAAVIVLGDDVQLLAEDIRECLKLHLAKFQIPVKIIFLDKMPLTANMKTDKRKIRRIFQEKFL